ncbi:c-type cytochrome [Azoarcus sp. KH32C]|uniref:c-type cytochrome n=1 Tax=Azoarcus sp. KH32C TaxID=748247 RepID=UPI0002386F36|nr:c-type cytochrome [Azoarcus sp. KH32C]BAL26093.1 cytochrome c family protein [Azoarcus sp. KH32C]
MQSTPSTIGLSLLLATSPVLAQSAPQTSLLDRPVPSLDGLPNDAYGELVRYGHELTTRTFAHIGPEVTDRRMRYAGNNLACTSCHENDATKPYAMPWVGVSASFPQYRAREDAISSVEERVNGCMERSMNGRPLPLDSREMKAFATYIHYLSRGIPIGAQPEGSGTKATKVPDRRADLAAGEAVYARNCAACHGADGQGQRRGKGGDAEGYTFPPLWGNDSFNSGAGMNRLLTAARFIKHNMPQGTTYRTPTLSDDESYDVAAYVLSKPRPVKAGLETDFPARWNKPVDAAFPPYIDGAPADQHRYGPYPPLIEQARQRAEAMKAAREARPVSQIK